MRCRLVGQRVEDLVVPGRGHVEPLPDGGLLCVGVLPPVRLERQHLRSNLAQGFGVTSGRLGWVQGEPGCAPGTPVHSLTELAAAPRNSPLSWPACSRVHRYAADPGTSRPVLAE